MVFGGSLALALIAGAGAAFAQRPRHAVLSLSASMVGVAGTCLVLGNDVLALVILVLLAASVPAALLVALSLAPTPEPDARAGRSGLLVAAGISVGFALLAWILTRTPWPPAGGIRQTGIEWLGSRLLTDHLLALDLMAALLGLAGIGAVALLRGRRASR